MSPRRNWDSPNPSPPSECVPHRVGRVLSIFSSRPNWDPPLPHPQASVPPLLPFGSGVAVHTRLWERGGGGGSQSGRGDRHCGTLYRYICNL